MEYLGGFCENEYDEFKNYLEVLGFDQIGCGGFRLVYGRKKIVVKIPRYRDGIIDNRVEAAAWRKYKSRPTDMGVNLAPCRILSNNCLMMVAVNPLSYWAENMPKWAALIDNSQVGAYKGRIVAYDFALDINERIQLETEWNTPCEFFQKTWLPNKKQREAKAV